MNAANGVADLGFCVNWQEVELKSGVGVCVVVTKRLARRLYSLRGDGSCVVKHVDGFPFRVLIQSGSGFFPFLDLEGAVYCRRCGCLDGSGRRLVSNLHYIIHVLTHRHEQVEKQSAAPHLHLHLHGSAALENLATPDNQG